MFSVCYFQKRCGPYFLSYVTFMRLCAAHRRTILTNNRKVLERVEFLKLKTHRRTEKYVILILLLVIFMRLCAAHRRMILTKKLKVFERDESLHLKCIGSQKKDVILIFFIMCHFHAFMRGAQTHYFDK